MSSKILHHKLRRDMRERKAQFAALIMTIFVGIMLYGASADAYKNLQASYNKIFGTTHFADFTIIGGDANSIGAAVRSVDGVADVAVRSQTDTPVRVGGDHQFMGRAVGMPTGKQPSVNKVIVLDGSYLPAGAKNEVLVEQSMWDHFHIKIGDKVEVYGPNGWQEVAVVGKAASAEYLWPARSRQDIITDPDDFGVLFAPEALVRASDPAAPKQVMAVYEPGVAKKASARKTLDGRLAALATEHGAIDTFTGADQPSNSVLSEDISGFNQMSYFFPILFLSAAGLATYVLLTRLVRQQQATIGMFFGNGMCRRTIYWHYVGFGLATGIAGAVPGMIGGFLLGGLISKAYTSTINVPITVIEVHPATIVIGLVFGVVAGFLSAAAPALVATRIEPARAMRGDVPTGVGHASLLERWVPLLRHLPTRWRMVLRNVARNRRRSIYTATGVVLSLMLILVSWGMVDTVNGLLAVQNEVQREDALAVFAEPVTADDLSGLQSIAAVDRVEPVAFVSAVLSRGDKQYSTTVNGFESDTQMHEFRLANGSVRNLPAHGLLAGSALAGELGIKVGDKVTVTFPQLGTTAETEVVDFIDEPLGTYAYATEDELASLAGVSPPGALASTAALRYKAGADGNAIRAAVTKMPGVVAFRSTKALMKMMSGYMALFYAFIGIMLAAGAAMALALIFTSMSVNISERRGEIATLRAEGMPRRTLTSLITAENLVIVSIGIPPGLVLGWLLAKAEMASYSTDLFSIDLQMNPSTFVFAAIAIIVVALISQWPGLRAIRRIDIATVVRERSV